MTRSAVLGLAGLLVAFSGVASQAADPPALIVDPGVIEVDEPANWDGLYVGGFVGGGVAAFFNDEGEEADVDSFSGGILGGAIGANFDVGNGIVLGVVGDVAATNIAATVDLVDHDVGVINWAASLRGRAGYDAGIVLPYLTAGLAVGNVTLWDFADEDASSTATHVGWTIGAGAELKVTEDLSVDALYRYTRYGEADYNIPTLGPERGSFETHTVQVGINWHF